VIPEFFFVTLSFCCTVCASNSSNDGDTCVLSVCVCVCARECVHVRTYARGSKRPTKKKKRKKTSKETGGNQGKIAIFFCLKTKPCREQARSGADDLD
jgi:hypothetical protein